MAKMMRLLLRVSFTLFLLTGSHIERAKAQNVFHVWFDTVTAKAGDTVEVNVYYTFTSTHAHTLNYFQLRFQYDSSEIFPIGYDLAGTASGMFFDTTTSHLGIAAQGQSELDLTNPVLIRIRFRVNRQLADTAFIRWDTSFDLFDQNENVDQVLRRDGWIRTATAAGHLVLRTPPITLHGVTAGYSPDSVAFELPFVASDITSANMQTALLTFTYDSTLLSLQSFTFKPGITNVYSSAESSEAIPGGRQHVSVWLRAFSGVIPGGDTIMTVTFMGLVGLDTVCTTLGDVSLRPTNPDGLIGNTVYLGNSICLEGEAPNAVVTMEESEANGLRVYPNPATAAVRIAAPDQSAPAVIVVFDMLGREVGRWNDHEAQWQLSPQVAAGIYRVVCEQKQKEFMKSLIIER